MSIVLSVYSKHAFKEFVLPAVNNTELTLVLEHGIFQIRDDRVLKLEVLDGEWYFQELEDRIHINDQDYDGRALQNQDTYTLVSRNRDVLAIVVRVEESPFTVYDKFRLQDISQVTIGTTSGNAVIYSAFYGGEQIISGNHAQLLRQQQRWSLKDQSANGVFVNDIRVHGTQVLEFGDRINIWGLRMVYLGEMLAISPCQELKLDRSVLRRFDFTALDQAE